MNNKIFLRKQYEQRRRAVPEALRVRWSARIVEQLYRLLGAYRRFAGIGVYLPMRSEPDILPAVSRWLAAGLRLCVPVLSETGWDWRRLLALPTTGIDPRNIPDSSLGSRLLPRIAVVPGLAFDFNGHRLGYGGGVYDRLLQKTTIAIGCAYPFQVRHHLPTEHWDRAMTAVVTPGMIFWPARSRSPLNKGANHGNADIVAADDRCGGVGGRRSGLFSGPESRFVNGC